jgi:hypothetical protein
MDMLDLDRRLARRPDLTPPLGDLQSMPFWNAEAAM